MKTKDLIAKSGGVILNSEIPIPETFASITTDTRDLQKNDIFVALKGKMYDGHQYIKEAILKGAALIFVEDTPDIFDVPIVKVKDTYHLLFDLASCYLEASSALVIAVTGSVGKTTTKELIASILSKKYRVLKSAGNKNNRIGIPQTIFGLTPEVDCLVVELGMNHFHEIEELSSLVQPSLAVITNIGTSHIGNLGSKKNILKAKMEITAGMNGGILVLNGHDSLLQKIRKIRCGKVDIVNKQSGNIHIEIEEQSVFGSKLLISNGVSQADVFFEIPGSFIIDDVALALHVGEILDVPFEKMIEALEEYKTMKQRLLVEPLSRGNILINDSYNSSYESLNMILELLKQSKEHKIFILGDILELGKNSKKIHQKIGKDIRKMNITEIYFIGREMKYAWKMCKKGKYFSSQQEWITYWTEKESFKEQSIVLVKGSRKMELEKLIPYIYDKTK